jgi:hypothetical protein
MSLFDDVKNLLASNTGATPVGDASAHFEQLAQSVGADTLAQGIAASMRSNETPPFGQIVSQLFSSASGEQKSAIVNTLLSSVSPDQRAQFAALIPGLTPGATVPTEHAADLTPAAIQTLAQHAEQHDAGIIEKMSAVYAAHPTLVKTLGAAAVTIAMRHIAQQRNQQA